MIFATNGAMQAVLMYAAMNLSSFGEGEDGALYVVNRDGMISRIEPMPTTAR
jgi:hypothetical protein